MAKRRSTSSHKHRKFNYYTGETSTRRRKKGFSLWWIIPISAIAAFILALLLGRFLGAQVDTPTESSGTETVDTSLDLPPVSKKVESIDGIFVTLEGIFDYTYDAISRQIPEGTSAISLSMFYSNRSPIYKSEVAEDCGKPSGELTLKNVFRYPQENGIYVSVPFPSDALASTSGPASSMTATYEIELIKELFEAGANEIIIKCSYESLESEDLLSHIASYVSSLKREVPEINVGFMISSEDVTKTESIDFICKYADFCAVDMSSAKDGESIISIAEPAIINILRYNMRILISGGGSDSVSVKLLALDSLGITNRQIITK